MARPVSASGMFCYCKYYASQNAYTACIIFVWPEFRPKPRSVETKKPALSAGIKIQHDQRGDNGDHKGRHVIQIHYAALRVLATLGA